MQRRAAAHELHRLEQLAQRTARDHDRQRLVAVHDAVAQVREEASGRHGAGGGDARAIGQRRGRSHPARVGCARATRRRVAPRRPRPQVRWLARRAVRARPACGVADGRAGAPARPVLGSRGRAPRRSRARRSCDGPVDEHGRFLASASALRAGRGAARRPRARAARGAARPASSPRPPIPGGARFAVALTHDIDTPWRWSAARPAGRGRPAQGRARGAATRHGCAPRGHRAGARAAPSPARQRPQLVARALRRGRAQATASARPASCWPRTAIRTTAPRPEAYDGAPRAPRGPSSTGSGSRSACTRATPASPTSALIAEERAVLSRLLGGPIAGNRHHYLRLPWHDGHPRARPARLLLRHDARLRRAPRAARRPLVPVPALGRRRGRAPAHPRAAARADGRDARGGALPRALARGGLGRGRARARPPARRAAAARASSGTTTASTASTGAAGTGSTSRLLDGIAARGGHADTAARADRRTGGTSDARPDRVVLLPARGRRAACSACSSSAVTCPSSASTSTCSRRTTPSGAPSIPGLAADIPPRRPCTARATAARRTRRRRPRACAAAHGARRSACARPCSGAASCCPTPRSPGSRRRARRRARGARARDRRRALDLAAQLGACHRRRHRAPRGRAVRGRFPRLLARQPAPALRAAQRARQARGRGAASRTPRCGASPPSAP